ncbi:MAG: sigma 54-interacting transcriptional regulator [Rhodothalassiaceae bacterium]
MAAHAHQAQAAALIKLATALATERDVPALMARIVRSARELTGAEMGAAYILDKTKKRLLPIVSGCSVVDLPPDRLAPVDLWAKGERNMRNHMAYAAFLGRIVRVDDAYRYSGFDFTGLYALDRALGYHTHSLLAAPMRDHEGLTIGTLMLANKKIAGRTEPVPFDQAAEDLVGAFAGQAGVALNNLRLIEENGRLIQALNRSNRQLKSENEALRQSAQRSDFKQIVGAGPAMAKVFDLMARIADTDATILVQGETGTGKELVASAIHASSNRKDKGFVAQNCAALPETLLESELFGYKKGAFTGADRDKKGLIELAHHGTLFLDEIGDMPLNLQAKLLRVLQEREVRPLGGLAAVPVDVRVIAATHCNLKEQIRSGQFREDLYYRLAVFPIEIPPLRDRMEDVPALVDYFLQTSAAGFGKQVNGVSPGALECFLSYDYPGNVRELRNLVERAVLMVERGGTIMPDHLAAELTDGSAARPDRSHAAGNGAAVADRPFRPLRDVAAEAEAQAIRSALESLNGNQTQTAKRLGISRRTLIEKMQKYGLAGNGDDATAA